MTEVASARSGHAFGLRLDSEFEILGLDGQPSPEALPGCELRLATSSSVDWTGVEARRVSTEGDSATIDFHEQLGYRLYARYFGTCVVSGDGSRIVCAPPPVPAWRWQRFLVGRVLPFAAMQRGYEILHASAIAFGDGVSAISAPSGWGKTSLAINLVLRSAARFVTDDVLVIEVRDGRPFVHPGLGMTNLRLAEEERLAGAATDLGDRLGRSGRSKSHYAVERESRALPLERLYLLTAGSGSVATITRVEATPPLLLASAFLVGARSPASLATLLGTCSVLASKVATFEVARAGEEGPAELADRLALHARA
jgi:hypothetical protein